MKIIPQMKLFEENDFENRLCQVFVGIFFIFLFDVIILVAFVGCSEINY